jgi:epoxyqueuosine reductase
MTAVQLTQSLQTEAHRLGFAMAGACPAVTPIGFHQLSQWLDAGYAGEMSYLTDRKSAYEHPRHVMSEVTSLLLLGMNYQTTQPHTTKSGTGRIARYAWGRDDYHDLIHERLSQLKKFAMSLDAEMKVRGVVDTAPLLEREFAQLAGIGWSAKNTMLISREHGSWFFLAALLLNVKLEYDLPFETDHCGTCRACLDACPTDAFPQPGVLDATKCISYLTIEHRTAIPFEYREAIGDWILGCDICQEVCPWNNKATISSEQAFAPLDGQNPIDLRELFSYDDQMFRQRFRKTPLWRPKRRGILRNAAIVLGNQADNENIPPLTLGLQDHESLVRGASAWALGRHQSDLAGPLLSARLKIESDAEVRSEIGYALGKLKSE